MVNKTSPGGMGGKKKIKKRYQYFFKKGVFKGGTMLPKGGGQNIFGPPPAQIVAPTPKQKPSYAPDPCPSTRMFSEQCCGFEPENTGVNIMFPCQTRRDREIIWKM